MRNEREASNNREGSKASFMYLRAILCTCTFQISVDFYYVPVGGRGGGEGELGRGGGRERVVECILCGYS